MADYAIGDVQGCYDHLQRLLEAIDFNERADRLWFVGDLVNRGPQSLEVLHFIRNLTLPAKISLGNHDLHLLATLFGKCSWKADDDTLEAIIQAPDAEELGHWLRKQSIACYSKELNIVMVHAGIAPSWNLSQALDLAKELENMLSGEQYGLFLEQMYGNIPNQWSDDLQGIDRLRAITNYFTRMRFCDAQGRLALDYKGDIEHAPPNLYPWYQVPGRKELDLDIVFGHWAALRGLSPHPKIQALDTGCLWGGALSALRLQDKKRFSVSCC